MRRLCSLALASSLVAGASACTGTDVGNPAVDVSLVVHDTSIEGHTLSGAWLAYSALLVHEPTSCLQAPVFEQDGPLVVDLFGGEPPPALRDLDIPEGAYCSMSLPYAQPEAEALDEAPADLAGVSVLLEGTRADGVAFRVRLARSDELALAAPNQGTFSLDSDTGTAFVAFDASIWLAALDLEAAVVTDGAILIEAGSNDALLSALDAALDSAATLFDDDDGNGALDLSERDEPGDALANGF